jgi:lambda repressor-like predicted transcriptional regulator
MDNPTARNDWRTELFAQGRTLRWLALNTGKSPRTVYAYSQGKLTPGVEWLERVAAVLDVEPWTETPR